MTVIEKKKALKKIIDKLPESNIDEAFFFVEDLVLKDEKRKEILISLLKKEKSLFEKLAQ
mgnify:FL=1